MPHILESHRDFSQNNDVTGDTAPRPDTNQRRWTSPSCETHAFGVLLLVLFVMWFTLLYSGVASVLHDWNTSRLTQAAAVAALANESRNKWLLLGSAL